MSNLTHFDDDIEFLSCFSLATSVGSLSFAGIWADVITASIPGAGNKTNASKKPLIGSFFGSYSELGACSALARRDVKLEGYELREPAIWRSDFPSH